MKLILFFLLLLTPQVLFAQNNPQYLRYIEKYKDVAIEQMKRYHIPASITLAQGLYESGAGSSYLARMANNHFGIKHGGNWKGKTIRHDDDRRKELFRSYNNVMDSYEDHSLFLTSRPWYAPLFKLDEQDYKGWAHGLKKAGYATNPQYAYRLIEIIESYQLYRYDRLKNMPDLVTNSNAETTVAINDNLNSATHQVYLYNDVPYIITQDNDNLQKIIKEFRIREKDLLNFNEMYKGYVLKANERLYLNKKKKHASKKDGYVYVVKPGDSMHSISQQLGIQLKKLYKLNKKNVGDSPLQVGTILRIH